MALAAADGDFSRRVLDALEAFRTPLGEGQRSAERGTVPQALADEFRALMEAPRAGETPDANAVSATQSAAVQSTDAPEAAAPVQNVSDAAPADAVRGPAEGTDAAARPKSVGEINFDSPVDLIRFQFSTNMHLFETKSFASIRGQAMQQFEENLKRTA